MNRLQACPAAAARCSKCAVRRLAICAALEESDLGEMDEIMTHKHLDAGQVLLLEGDYAAYVANVLKGALKVFKSLPDGRTQLLRILLPGDFLGATSRDHYGYSAVALTDTELCLLPHRPLVSVFQAHPELEESVRAHIEDELAEAQEQVLSIGRKTALERVAGFLLARRQHALRVGNSVDPLKLPLTRSEIGEYLGLTTETVSRCMTRLKTKGVISLAPGHAEIVTFNDVERLSDLASAGVPA